MKTVKYALSAVALAGAAISLASPAHAGIGLLNTGQSVAAVGSVGGQVYNLNVAKSDVITDIVRHHDDTGPLISARTVASAL
jgi:hypothetical protein